MKYLLILVLLLGGCCSCPSCPKGEYKPCYEYDSGAEILLFPEDNPFQRN